MHRVIQYRIDFLLSQPRSQPGKKVDLLAPLTDSDHNMIMNTASQWCLISVLADTGATKHVSPLGVFDAKAIETDRSKSGHKFYAANGEAIPNKGSQRVHGTTDAGRAIAMEFNVADISRPIASIGELSGNRTGQCSMQTSHTSRIPKMVHGCQ